jgi:adenine deaminase
MLPALNDSGGLLMSGTDASLAVIVPGFSLHDELETMADVGLSPYDVLRTSTYNPALYLGELGEFGTVEVGKRADLVLLEGNPLDDIANTRQIAGVMVRGRWYSRADLDIMLEKVAEDYEAADATQSMLEVAFPIVAILLLVALVWFVVRRVRRRKANQISS